MKQPLFSFQYPVRLEDLDYMAIVGNAQWLNFLLRARIDLLDELKFSFSKLEELKVGAVVARAEIDYLRPAKFGDCLKITIEPHSFFEKGVFLRNTVQNNRGEVCLKAELKMVFVNSQGRATHIPEGLRLLLAAQQSSVKQ